jgi:hypothetical protein
MYQVARKPGQHEKYQATSYGKYLTANIRAVDIVDVRDYLGGFDVDDKYLQITFLCYIFLCYIM